MIELTAKAYRLFDLMAALRGPWRVRVPDAGPQLQVARIVDGHADWSSAVVVTAERPERGPA